MVISPVVAVVMSKIFNSVRRKRALKLHNERWNIDWFIEILVLCCGNNFTFFQGNDSVHLG
jgi:hypothetical protein